MWGFWGEEGHDLPNLEVFRIIQIIIIWILIIQIVLDVVWTINCGGYKEDKLEGPCHEASHGWFLLTGRNSLNRVLFKYSHVIFLRITFYKENHALITRDH